MLFLQPPTTSADIRGFCARFSEGIRVEYKSRFDVNVRNKIAKIVSGFANTLGGALVIGVNTNNGAPQQPIEGFETPDEELSLVIEQICLTGINPPVIPKVTQIESDVAGRSFLVLEIEESPEAPHAIENQKKVFIRTGNATSPYEIADVELIIERFTRRQELTKHRVQIIEKQIYRSSCTLAPIAEPTVRVCVGPTFPHRALAAREEIWEFATTERYRGGHFIPGQSLRRSTDGVCGAVDNRSAHVDLTQHGFVLWEAKLARGFAVPGNAASHFLTLRAVLVPIFKALVLASRLYARLHYKGAIQIDLEISRCNGERLPFLPHWERQHQLEDFSSIDEPISAQEFGNAETLHGDLTEITKRAVSQLCWPFWQSLDGFPGIELDAYVQQFIDAMGQR